MKFLFSGVAALSALTNAAYLDEWQANQYDAFTCDGTAWFFDSRFADMEAYANPDETDPGAVTADMANTDVHTFGTVCNNNYFGYYDDPSVYNDKRCICMPAYIRDPSWDYNVNYGSGMWENFSSTNWYRLSDGQLTYWTLDGGGKVYLMKNRNVAPLGQSARYLGLHNLNDEIASVSQQMNGLSPGATYQISVTYGGRNTNLNITVRGAIGFYVDDVYVGGGCYTSESDNIARICKGTFTATSSSQKLSLKNMTKYAGNSLVVLENLIIGKIADPCATGSFDLNSLHSTSDINGCSQCQLTTVGDGSCGVGCQCNDNASTASRTYQSFTDCTGKGKVLSVADGDLQCADYCQLSNITGTGAATCIDCSTDWNTDHCNLTCTCPDGDGGDKTTTLKLTEGAPVQNIGGVLTHAGDSTDGSAGFSAADLDVANLASERLVCGDASEVNFKTMYKHVEGRYHVDLNPSDSEADTIKFSARGTSGINIALTNSANFPAENLSEGFSGAYEIFIGPESEPVIHVSECMGCAPKKIANVGVNPYIKAGAETDVYVQVVSESNGSTTIKVGVEGEDADLEYNFIGYVDVDEAVFTYGYGDMECECPETETYSINIRNKSVLEGFNDTYDVMTVNLRTMIATFPGNAINNRECQNYKNKNTASNTLPGELDIDLSGTPFQLADMSGLTLNTDHKVIYSGSEAYLAVGPFYTSGWNSVMIVNCSTVQNCSVEFDGYCATAGVWNYESPPYKTNYDDAWVENAGMLYVSTHNTAKVEYVSGFADNCSGIANTEAYEIPFQIPN